MNQAQRGGLSQVNLSLPREGRFLFWFQKGDEIHGGGEISQTIKDLWMIQIQ